MGRLWTLCRTDTLPTRVRPRPAASAALVVSTLGWLLLLVVVAAAGYVVFRRRRPVRRPAATAPPSGDDLTSLGLSEVRVRPADAPARAPADPDPVLPGRAAEFEPARPAAQRTAPPAERRPAEAPERARPRPSGPYVREGTALWPDGDRSAALLLASLAEHVGGPAAVVAYDADADAYVVEALAPAGRSPEPVPAEACPLHRAPQDRVVTLLDADELDGLEAVTGGGPVYARALAEPPAARAFLVASADGAGGPDALDRYADLLADLSALGAAPTPAPADAASGPDAEPALESDVPAAVPRADIIREEQEAARDADRPLAFALVTLADAEALLEGDPAVLAEAEAALRDRLGAADGVRRVEPFGDLLFGAFLALRPSGAADWCDALASGEPPLFIGAVAPADAAPEAVRDAAADALRDAYVKRRAQVVGAE